MKISQLTYTAFVSFVMVLMANATNEPTAEENLGSPITIGEIEYVGIIEAGTHFEARIDTGAETCSIHAENIEAFERDGKKWVRFHLINPSTKQPILLERPLTRKVRIKHHELGLERRFVIKLRTALGAEVRNTEFTLLDRSIYDFPLLVGRNLLHETAVVDVSRHHTLEKVDLSKIKPKTRHPKRPRSR